MCHLCQHIATVTTLGYGTIIDDWGECNVFLCVQLVESYHTYAISCLLAGDNVSFLAYKQPLTAFQIATESINCSYSGVIRT